jgi:hypothetical protein
MLRASEFMVAFPWVDGQSVSMNKP